ncbi:MAG: hypothetical protein IH840_17315 [Candidatus Heimdallarchaeota archaeon]|nr:hypothetical protein [Candidatus Heimdallarchaeota archaeon]
MKEQGCPFGLNRIGQILLEGGLRFPSTKTHTYAESLDYALEEIDEIIAYDKCFYKLQDTCKN